MDTEYCVFPPPPPLGAESYRAGLGCRENYVGGENKDMSLDSVEKLFKK